MTELWLGFLFSSVGFGFFLYGKKQHKIIPLCVGLGLCVFPYMIQDWRWMLPIGMTLICIPLLIKA